MRTIDHVFSGFRDKSNRSLYSSYKSRMGQEDDVVTYFVMTISVFILGVIVLIKLFTGI